MFEKQDWGISGTMLANLATYQEVAEAARREGGGIPKIIWSNNHENLMQTNLDLG